MHRPQKAEDEAGKRLLLDNLLGLAGDHQLLIGGDDQHAHIAAPAGDVAHVAVAVLVLVHIVKISKKRACARFFQVE